MTMTTAGAVQLRRVLDEFVHNPGLRLTRPQAQRLWGLDANECVAMLESLVDSHFLIRAPDGMYSRRTPQDEGAGAVRMSAH